MKKLFTASIFCLLAIWGSAQNFNCNSDLYQVVNGRDLKRLDPATGIYQTIGSSSITYNGAGFNYQDGYIYGIGSGTILVRINNTGEATNLGSISNFSALSYSGDFDTLGNWYSFRKISENWIMNSIDVSVSPPVAVESPITELPGVTSSGNCADISFNAVTGKFYGMTGGKLHEFNPTNQTVRVIADYSSSTGSGGYGAVWSDNQGNTYFFNNGTGNIYRAQFDSNGNILSFGFSATSASNSSNDGMSCPLGAPPVFPEICNNGLDDDGDGLIDCEDPDCTASESCGVSGEIYSSNTACESSIATYHTFFTNNSSLDNTITVTEVLPTGFTFLQDTIEFDGAGSNAGTFQPVEGDQGTIKWGPLTLRGGETVRVSYDVTLNETVVNGINSNNITIELSTAGTNAFPTTLTSPIAVGPCPTPEVYTCEPAFYQVYKKRGKNQPNVYGKLDPETGDYNAIAVASDYANGLGFDINTGLVYGASGRRFIQLDEAGVVIDKGITFNKKVYKGDIDESSKWYGVDGSDMVKIDVSGVPFVEATYIGQGLPGWDIAYNNDGNFYSVHNQTLHVFNTTTNTKSSLGLITGINLPTNGGYGAQWTGSDGRLYISHNSSGKIVQVNVETLEARVVSTSIDGLSKNDGFSCPTEIPVVFEYDLSDNNRLPQSRVLAYRQDLSSDGIPDYSTVWIGNTVTFDTTDPQNANADGDLDDGFTLATEIDNGELSSALGLNSNQSAWAYHLIGIDWDDNGTFDEIIRDSTYLTGAQTILGSIAVPQDFTEGDINLRVLISEEKLQETNISGEIIGMGEVEDYRYTITSPCVGEGCDVGSGSGGGLESNGSLSAAISKRNYYRAKENFQGNLKSNQLKLKTYKASRTSSNKLDLYFPGTGIKGTEEVTVSSPTDLIQLTNAKDVFALDYYEKDSRVAASLILTTEGNVYNHSKNICDRLHGKSIEDVKLANLNGIRIIYAKIRHENGAVEYSAWFAARDLESKYEVLSFWGVEDYPEGDYLNFQAWGSSPSQVFHILGFSLEHLREQKEVVNDETLQQLPKLLVKSGAYADGKLQLTILNRTQTTSLLVNANLRRTELSNYESLTMNLALSGMVNEIIEVETGHIFDAGISLGTGDGISDVLYLADGAWGTDFNPSLSSINEFSINEEENLTDIEGYKVERGFSLEAQSGDVVNIFRNIKAGDRTMSLAPYKTLGFNVSNSHPLEVVLVEKGLEYWEDRLKITMPAQPTERRVLLNLEEFDGMTDKRITEIQSIVFSYLNQTGARERVTTNISDIVFGNEVSVVLGTDSEESSVLIYPNPVSTSLNLKLAGSGTDAYTTTIFNSSGQVVTQKSGSLSEGQNDISIGLDGIKPGIYFIKVNTSKIESTQKIIIK